MTSAIYWLGGELYFSPSAQVECATGNQLDKLKTRKQQMALDIGCGLMAENLKLYVCSIYFFISETLFLPSKAFHQPTNHTNTKTPPHWMSDTNRNKHESALSATNLFFCINPTFNTSLCFSQIRQEKCDLGILVDFQSVRKKDFEAI